MKRKLFLLAAMLLMSWQVFAVSGTCGDNLTWNLTNGVLTISGTGSMQSYSSPSKVPWYSNVSSINTVIIENGVTTIGSYAFSSYPGLTSVTIPNSVTSIEWYAFFNSSSLLSVAIPDDVEWIGNNAFNGCTSITSVIIPKGVKYIDERAFFNCTSLSSITINGNIINIGNYVFGGCSSLAKVFWNAQNGDLPVSVFPNNLDSLIVGENVEEVGISSKPPYYIEFRNPLTRVRSYAAPKVTSFYDYNQDGVMEVVDTVIYKVNSSTYRNMRFKNMYGWSVSDDLLDAAYTDLQTINLNNDALIDFIIGSTLYQANNSGGYDKFELDYTKNPSSYNGDHLFALDADLNGTTDFYSYEDGVHYLHLRQFDGTYLKTELNIIEEQAEIDSALYAYWDRPKTGMEAIIIVEDHLPSLAETMFLVQKTIPDNYKSIDVAIDLDKNGWVDLLSSSTGAVLYNLGNNKFLKGQFPGAVTVKDLNNDGIEDYVIYDESTKTVSLQIYESSGSYNTIPLMQNMNISNVWCYDFDNDGDIDILLPFDWTSASGYAYLVFWRNDGDNTFKKVETAFDDPIKHFQFLDCRDVDNDGKYEIIARDSLSERGTSLGNVNYYLIRYNNRLKATMDATPFAANTVDYLAQTSPFIYGDFDNDGNNECYYYGRVSKRYINSSGYYNVNDAVLARFANTKPNTPPQKMSQPRVAGDAETGKILVSWDQGSDAESPNIDLVYSMRIGSAPGLSDMWYASALNDGKQTSLNAANAGAHLSQIVNLGGWKEGYYYISVQAIDPNGLGGAWSDEVVYHHALPSAMFNINKKEIATADTIRIQYAGIVDNSATYHWNFGDSATIIASDVTKQVYEFVYNTAGVKTISLQVATADGRTSSTYSIDIKVYPMRLEKGIAYADNSNYMAYFDMDMDGRMDALGYYYLNGTQQQGFFKGKADGSFMKLAKTYNSDLTIDNIMSLSDSCIFADFNMDGLPDVQWSTNKGTTMYNREDFDMDFTYETYPLPYTKETYDFDGDGIDDEVKIKNTYALAIILKGENGENKDTIELDLPSGYTLQADGFGGEKNPHIMDVDNNGTLDFVVIPQNFDFVGRFIYVIYLNEDWTFYCQDLPYQYYNDYYRTYHYESLLGYPFVDLNSDGTPDFKRGYFMKSRITNEAPSVPTNLRAVQESDGVYLYWDAAKDKETPAAQMRYNISVKKKGVAIGTDNAFVVSPMNGLYDEANIVPGYYYPHRTSYFIPIDKLTGGQTYEFQIQSIDLWNAHSPMSAAYAFTVQPQVLISMPAQTCMNEPVTVAYTGTNNGDISWNFDGGIASQNTDGTYSVHWAAEGVKTVKATLSGNTSSRAIYVQNTLNDLTFTLPERVLNNSWTEVTLPATYENLEHLAIRTSANCTGYILPKKNSRIFQVCFNSSSADDTEIGWVEFFQNDPVCGEVNTFRASTQILGMSSAPAISLVMVDATTGKNMITWDAPANLPSYIDNIIVYKEEGKTNNWVMQAKVPVSAGQWIDPASDPSVKSHSYCIAYTSIYGGESPKSTAHKTPHLQTNYGLHGAINLYWTYYQGDVVDSYQILRGSSTTNMQVLTTVAGDECTYTDNSPIENGYYAISYSNSAFTNEWMCVNTASNAPAYAVQKVRGMTTRTGRSNIMAAAASIPATLATQMTILSMEKTYTLSPSRMALHLYVEITPSQATFKQVRWSIVSGHELVTIYSNGLLVANSEGKNGTVRVRATAIDGSGVYTERAITISGFKKTLHLLVNDAEMGTVNGAGQYTEGQIVTISAVANYGYHFEQWNDGNTDNPRTITFMQDTTFIAEFAKNSYTITTASNPLEYGTTTGGGSALYNDQITISATAYDGYHFVQWNDGNTDNPRTITVTDNKLYTATFAKNTYTITKIANPDHCTVEGPTQAEYLQEVKLSPIPSTGYHFSQWSDGDLSNPRKAIITQDTTFTAKFAKNVYTINVSTYTSHKAWGVVTGAGEYEYGSTAVISAEPNYGYHFKYWGHDNNTTKNPLTITVTENKDYVAYFAKNTYSITVEYNPDQGTVTYPSEAEYLSNVNLYATPKNGYQFVQWSDGNTSNSHSFAITQDTTFTATFEPKIYIVTFKNDDGTIIDQVEFPYGAMPTHEDPVKPSNGIYSYTFTGWVPALAPVTGNATYTAQYQVVENPIGDCEDVHETWLQTGQSSLGEMIADSTMWHNVPSGGSISGIGSDFLRTPAKNLTNMSSVTLSFSHMYVSVSTANLTLWVCADFTNSENDYWEQLAIPSYKSNDFVTVNIDIPTNKVGRNTVFGFSYFSDNRYSNWIIKNLKLDAVCVGSTPPQPTYYTIRFLNYDGTELQSSQVEEGEMPVYTGATPTRPNDETYTYTFKGWSPAVVAATANADYTAQYTATEKPVATTHTVTILSNNKNMGTVTGSGVYAQGSNVNISAVPNYGYHFSYWDDELVPSNAITATEAYTIASALAKNETTTEVYTVVGYITGAYGNYTNSYYMSDSPGEQGQFVIWKANASAEIGDHVMVTGILTNYRGTTPETCEGAVLLPYPESGTNAVRTIIVNSDTTITAIFAPNKYTITFKNDDGSVLCSDEWEYGAMPFCEEPTKADDEQYSYTFAGWTPKISQVTEAATYTATYTAEPINHEGVTDVYAEPQATKIIHKDKIFILRGNKIYTVQGQEVR